MKKFWLLLFFSVIAPFKLHAASTDEGVTREKTYVVHFTTSVVTASTTSVFVLVSLSTTSSPAFPHIYAVNADRGEIDVSHINLVIDKVAAATTTVKIGVMNYVGTSTGSATFFFTQSALKNVSNTNATLFDNFTPSFYRCKVIPSATPLTDGLTPFIMSNDKRSGSTLYNLSGTVGSPVGQIVPQRGDIVMEVSTDGSNSVNIAVDVWYHAEQ